MRGLVSLAGAMLMGVGAGLHYLPAGFIVFGLVLYLDILVMTLMDRRKS